MSSVGPGDGTASRELKPEDFQDALIKEVAEGKSAEEPSLTDTEKKVIAHAVKIWSSLSEGGRASKYKMMKNKVVEEIKLGKLGKESAWNLENVTEENTNAVQGVYTRLVLSGKVELPEEQLGTTHLGTSDVEKPKDERTVLQTKLTKVEEKLNELKEDISGYNEKIEKHCTSKEALLEKIPTKRHEAEDDTHYVHRASDEISAQTAKIHDESYSKTINNIRVSEEEKEKALAQIRKNSQHLSDIEDISKDLREIGSLEKLLSEAEKFSEKLKGEIKSLREELGLPTEETSKVSVVDLEEDYGQGSMASPASSVHSSSSSSSPSSPASSPVSSTRSSPEPEEDSTSESKSTTSEQIQPKREKKSKQAKPKKRRINISNLDAPS